MELQQNGLSHNGKTYSVNLLCCGCDRPGRELVECIIGHGGYNSCERCIQRGIHMHGFGVRIFPKLTNVRLRTNESFVQQTDKNHHTGWSPLLDLNVDMINWFPLDYMHLVLLGVFKRLLGIWKGSWNKKSNFYIAVTRLWQCLFMILLM